MRLTTLGALSGLLVTILSQVTLGGITVTSYETLAETNGFAPSLSGPYFAQQILTNVTPALAEVSGDWMGPNADGTPATWHFVGTSRARSTTTIDANSYTITAAGSFDYELNTTADFVDPQPSVFAPTGAASYDGHFTVDLPVSYSVNGVLNQWGRVRLAAVGGGTVVFDQANATDKPMVIDLTGTIPPGQYRFLVATGLSAPGFPNGINHFGASGSYEDIRFNVQVPEPSALGLLAH